MVGIPKATENKCRITLINNKMKYLALILPFMFLTLIACNEEQETLVKEEVVNHEKIEQPASGDLKIYDKVEIQEILTSLNSNSRVSGWWEKVKKWINKHTGTYTFNNCPYSNPCGPCPGMCINAGVFDGDDNGSGNISQAAYQAGLRLFGLAIVENQQTGQEKLLFEFDQNSEFLYNGNLYFTQDLPFSNKMLGFFNRNSITIKAGIYPVVFNSTGKGETIVDAIIQ